jgi:hypothetical protein
MSYARNGVRINQINQIKSANTSSSIAAIFLLPEMPLETTSGIYQIQTAPHNPFRPTESHQVGDAKGDPWSVLEGQGLPLPT